MPLQPAATAATHAGHATHDIELVAAHASGDATGVDLEMATALVASCTDCAALHAEILTIAAAMPDLPAPVRTRDFRITLEQAASLRPTGWRALVGALAAPRFRFAVPLGTGMAALGLAAVLVASGGMPVGGGTAAGTGSQAPMSVEAAPEAQPADAGAEAIVPSPDPDLALKAVEQPSGTAAAEALDESGPAPLLVAGILLLVAAGALVATRVLARKLARAP